MQQNSSNRTINARHSLSVHHKLRITNHASHRFSPMAGTWKNWKFKHFYKLHFRKMCPKKNKLKCHSF